MQSILKNIFGKISEEIWGGKNEVILSKIFEWIGERIQRNLCSKFKSIFSKSFFINYGENSKKNFLKNEPIYLWEKSCTNLWSNFQRSLCSNLQNSQWRKKRKILEKNSRRIKFSNNIWNNSLRIFWSSFLKNLWKKNRKYRSRNFETEHFRNISAGNPERTFEWILKIIFERLFETLWGRETNLWENSRCNLIFKIISRRIKNKPFVEFTQQFFE